MNLDLNKLRSIIDLSVEDLANEIGVSYYDMGQILCKCTKCPNYIKEKLKNFFLNIYTKHIENVFEELEAECDGIKVHLKIGDWVEYKGNIYRIKDSFGELSLSPFCGGTYYEMSKVKFDELRVLERNEVIEVLKRDIEYFNAFTDYEQKSIDVVLSVTDLNGKCFRGIAANGFLIFEVATEDGKQFHIYKDDTFYGRGNSLVEAILLAICYETQTDDYEAEVLSKAIGKMLGIGQ